MITSRNCIKIIAPYIHKEVFDIDLLTIILRLLHDSERETNIIAGIKLLGDIVTGFDQ